MPVTRINPPDVFEPDRFLGRNIQSEVVTASGGTLIFLSGQWAVDATTGELIGEGDYAAQFKAAYANLDKALAAAGATRDDVIKQTIYVVDYNPDRFDELLGWYVAAGLDRPQPPAGTLVGVASLGLPGYLVEVDAVAFLSD
jgi:enamine deaminase RidA (YjgF/YER057c/UK114 family)